MKKIYPIALALSFFCFTIHSAKSQHTFEEKKKTNVGVDASSLNAAKITRSKSS